MEPIVIAVRRKRRKSESLIRGAMIALAALFLLEGILFSRGFMLPCFLMTLACFLYGFATRREYEYTLEEGLIRIERVTDYGRRCLHEIRYDRIELLTRPDSPEAAPYKKGGSVRVRKYDYTSYEEEVPYYTLIAGENGQKYKFLLDLTPEAIARIRRCNPAAVRL